MAMFWFLQFVTDVFDLCFDLGGVDHLAVVFHHQPFGRIRDVGIQNSGHPFQNVFNDVGALRRIHAAHEPGFVQVTFGDFGSDGFDQLDNFFLLNQSFVVMHADFGALAVSANVSVCDARV